MSCITFFRYSPRPPLARCSLNALLTKTALYFVQSKFHPNGETNIETKLNYMPIHHPSPSAYDMDLSGSTIYGSEKESFTYDLLFSS